MTTLPAPLTGPAARLLDLCRARGWTLATAESCTGGLIAASLTAIAGSSDVVERGFVTYSNRAKHELLSVPEGMLAQFGAVSEQVARAMADGVLEHAPVDLAVAVTGIAGPGGGSADKPVGLVHLAAVRRDGTMVHQRHVFPGDRDAVRQATAATALAMLIELVE
jgi:nicotinamide-nucleotide amidase